MLTLPDSIAWLLNIRGSDVAHNPVALAFAIVPATGKPELFVDSGQDRRARPRRIWPRWPRSARPRRSRRGSRRSRRPASASGSIPATAAFWFFRKLKGGKARVVRATDPCILPKARKNAAEIKGTRAAHKRDGAAVVRFLAWLDREAPKGGVDEIGAARQLETMRAETQALKEISFDTISGAGSNGAIVHYRVTTATNRKLGAGRAVPGRLGRPVSRRHHRHHAHGRHRQADARDAGALHAGPEGPHRHRHRAVSRRARAASSSIRSRGARCGRRALDFDHGTGHGVGSYLSVHEGPQSISKRGMVVLEPGMIISNEPGYYKEGAYGIRIENLVLVDGAREAGRRRAGDDGLRDADAGADRPAAGGARICWRPTSWPGSTPTTPACAR